MRFKVGDKVIFKKGSEVQNEHPGIYTIFCCEGNRFNKKCPVHAGWTCIETPKGKTKHEEETENCKHIKYTCWTRDLKIAKERPRFRRLIF